VISRFHKWLLSLSNHFYKRVSNARLAYSNFPIYGLKLVQLVGHSICLVVTRHFFLMSSNLFSTMSSRAKQLGGHIRLFPSIAFNRYSFIRNHHFYKRIQGQTQISYLYSQNWYSYIGIKPKDPDFQLGSFTFTRNSILIIGGQCMIGFIQKVNSTTEHP